MRNHNSKKQKKQPKASRRAKPVKKAVKPKKVATKKPTTKKSAVKKSVAVAKKKSAATKPTPKQRPSGPVFLYGPIHTPYSSWVASFGCLHTGKRGESSMGVAVQFKDGFECLYPNTDVSDYQYLRKAKSRGRAIHARFYRLDYVAI